MVPAYSCGQSLHPHLKYLTSKILASVLFLVGCLLQVISIYFNILLFFDLLSLGHQIICIENGFYCSENGFGLGSLRRS